MVETCKKVSVGIKRTNMEGNFVHIWMGSG
jgi:hypothetical protein